MKKRQMFYAVLTALVLSTSVVGCGNEEAKPVAIDEKVDKCDICNMTVKNNQFAVELMQKDGKAMKFDDLGCLFQWTEKNGKDQVGTQYVRDYATQEWVKLDEATYVFDKEIATPMAYNVISFKSKADAEAFQKKEGKGDLLSYEDLLKHTWERNKDMMKKMMEMSKDKHGEGGNSSSHSSGM